MKETCVLFIYLLCNNGFGLRYIQLITGVAGFLWLGNSRRSGGWKSPSVIQGQSPGGVLGRSPQ